MDRFGEDSDALPPQNTNPAGGAADSGQNESAAAPKPEDKPDFANGADGAGEADGSSEQIAETDFGSGDLSSGGRGTANGRDDADDTDGADEYTFSHTAEAADEAGEAGEAVQGEPVDEAGGADEAAQGEPVDDEGADDTAEGDTPIADSGKPAASLIEVSVVDDEAEAAAGATGIAAGSTLDTFASGVGGYPARVYAEDLDDEDDEDDSGGVLGGLLPQDFWGHVEELRWVLIKAVLTFVGAMVLMMLFSVRAQKLLTWPLSYGIKLSGAEHVDILLRTDGPFSVFTFMLQLWVFGGLLLSLPFILYFMAGFIAPGLTPKERKLLRPVAFSALGLFLVGCLFAFFLLLPTYMAVSLALEKTFGFASLWTPANYYGAVVWTTLGLGVVFEFPLVLVLLQWLGLISPDTLRKYRRHAFVFMLVFAAFLTPGGDPITLFMATLPLYALFEGSLLIGDRILRKRARENAEAEVEDE